LRMSEPKDLRLSIELMVDEKKEFVHFINTGVPHAVIPVSRVDDVDVRRRGEKIRRHKMFSPKGANVNFIEKRDARNIAIRTYERGVEDETLACGTGVVASALIFAATENSGDPEKNGSEFRNVTLTGPAEFVFEGTIEL